MSELTAEGVYNVFFDCLFDNPKEAEGHEVVKGIAMSVVFNPKKIEEHREEIINFLKQLPDGFMEKKGGGLPFTQACLDKNGAHWGEHRNVDQLLTLGKAIGMVKSPTEELGFPAELFGGIHYYTVLENS